MVTRCSCSSQFPGGGDRAPVLQVSGVCSSSWSRPAPLELSLPQSCFHPTPNQGKKSKSLGFLSIQMKTRSIPFSFQSLELSDTPRIDWILFLGLWGVWPPMDLRRQWFPLAALRKSLLWAHWYFWVKFGQGYTFCVLSCWKNVKGSEQAAPKYDTLAYGLFEAKGRENQQAQVKLFTAP